MSFSLLRASQLTCFPQLIPQPLQMAHAPKMDTVQPMDFVLPMEHARRTAHVSRMEIVTTTTNAMGLKTEAQVAAAVEVAELPSPNRFSPLTLSFLLIIDVPVELQQNIPMKQAIIILVHKNAEQLMKLIKYFDGL